MKIVDGLFSCNPNCSVESLTVLDWIAVFGFFFLIYFVSTVWKKWAFSRNKYPEASIKWHLPRFLYIAIVFTMATLPIAWWLFGCTGAKIFGQLVLPELVFVIYLLWAVSSEKYKNM